MSDIKMLRLELNDFKGVCESGYERMISVQMPFLLWRVQSAR